MNRNRSLAILISGRGSNFVAIQDAIRRGDLKAEICCVSSNVPDAAGLTHAKNTGLPALVLPSGESIARSTTGCSSGPCSLSSRRWCAWPFMRILTPEFLDTGLGTVCSTSIRRCSPPSRGCTRNVRRWNTA